MNLISNFAGQGIPSPALMANEIIRLYGIVHFGLNTWTGQEWGMGDASPELFNPTGFDAGRIVREARSGGLQGIILVCKHHDGFCLWPTATTEYNISRSPFRNGQGDMVGEFADACRAEGLRFGVYISPWDRNSAWYGTSRYQELFQQQIREVLTRYGTIFEMWFDGANGGNGYYGGARETRTIDASSYYQWEKVWSMVRFLQPEAAIFSDVGPDRRWCGNEKGYLPADSFCSCNPAVPRNSLCPIPCPGNADSSILQSGTSSGAYYLMPECDFPLRSRWFYHPDDDATARSPAKLLEIYLHSVGNGGTMNVGLAPDQRGRLTDSDVRTLREFRRRRDALFADCQYSGTVEFSDHPLILSLDGEKSFQLLRFRESFETGEQILSYSIEGRIQGQWQLLISGQAVGAGRIRRIPTTVTDLLRICAATKSGALVPVKLELFSVPETLFLDDKSQISESSGKGIIPSQRNGRSVLLDLQESSKDISMTFVPVPGAPGTPDRFRLEGSPDGLEWKILIPEGEFSNIRANPIPQEIIFSSGTEIRFLRFTALHTLMESAECVDFERFERTE